MSGLRKVTADMQTHKNPHLRQGPAPFKAAGGTGPTKPLPQPGAGAFTDKPPVFARDGKKWLIVSNYSANKCLVSLVTKTILENNFSF